MNQELKITAIDGNSFSGKTTLVEGMRTKYLYPVIHEYDVYANGGSKFPNFPPDNYCEAKKSIDYFLDIEIRRSSEAVNKALQTNTGLLMDRSFYACINFQYLVKKMMPNIANAYKYSLELFIRHLEKQTIVAPGVLVYLEPESPESIQRRIQRRGMVKISFLNDPETFNTMKDWYQKLIEHLYSPNSSKTMKSLDDRLDTNVEELHNFLLNANFSIDKSVIISNLSTYYER